MALFNLTLNLVIDTAQLGRIEAALAVLNSKGNVTMEQIKEVAAAAAASRVAAEATKAAVDALPAKIDALEAKVTAAINNAGLSDEDKADLAAALSDLRATTTAAQEAAGTATAAGADADDGVDEAATATG